jgi:manganese transport protein
VIATRQELPEGLRTVDEALHRTRFRILPFLGPAFIACIAYIDPGNFATNVAGGSRFGYRLVWVIVAANLLAMLIQTLSASSASRLGTCRRSRVSTAAPNTFFLWPRRRRSRWRPTCRVPSGDRLHLLFGFALFVGGADWHRCL